MDTDHHIFSFLLNAQGKVGLQLDNVYHVISELVRSQTFSVARYLQWLIAKGVVNSHQDNVGKVSIASINDKVKYLTNEQKMSPHVELLRHLPVGRLPEHVRSLRNTLMLRAGFPASEEGPVIDALKSLIGRHLPGIFGAESRSDLGAPGNVTLLDQTHAVRSEIGQWIRSGVSRHSGNIVTR
jgi:mediator of RNA polymerase II transcription subunit 12